ncbi:amino acid adenylation domain-containing protein [Acidithiobacillus ferrooxidans]|uniref:non-ribosomal peptide synthetase n=1 Tax=Acidithiobacillus ferrooxidans TaxID=920 RepID=UPI0021498D68|nr:amino acid adenylation domain-containing protein [Acidithiobacillus ferrooxidans]MCR1346361.1 amino acid adenylation domain-containing protein [Acidithiobacillus ferrooxidans]MCR1355305.1 amino acid adenylation domain-containing protein [Acidithiobacillus ferrooxidans]
MHSHYPLTKAQFAIWAAQMLDPESPAYNIGEYIEISGAIDPDLLRTAVRHVFENTGALRLLFVVTEDGPRQYVAQDEVLDVPYFDLIEDANARAMAEAWMRRDMQSHCDLTRGPLCAFAIFKVNANCFFYYHRNHHIVSDGYSGTRFVRRVALRYASLLRGSPVETENASSWFDTLREEESYIASARYARDRNYWMARLKDGLKQATLSGKPPAVIPPREFLRVTDFLPNPVAEKLRTLGGASGASLAQVVTAAAALYFSRFTGESDIVIGMAASARVGAKVRNSDGMVVNVLPLRLTIDPQLNFEEFIREASRTMRDAFRHQRYRSEDLRHDLQLPPNVNSLHGVIVNVMSFDFVPDFAGCPVQVHNVSNGPVFDLSLTLYGSERTGGLRIDLDGNPSHYRLDCLTDHMQRLLDLFCRAVESAQDIPLSQFSVLMNDERRTVLYDWNATMVDYLRDKCVHQLFEEQAARAPDAVAAAFEDQYLTYGELDRRANRLAHRLVALGVGPETLVGVCLERSLDLIVGLLGVLKAGGAYLPLDPAYPQARLAFMLSDARAPLLLTQQTLLDRLPAFGNILCMDRDGPEIDALPDTPPRCDATPDNLAYVIYTSGSTGQPKGVMVGHRNLANLVGWHRQAYEVVPTDRATQIAGLAFDASVWEIWPYLAAGASVHITDEATRLDPVRLVRWLVEQRITLTFLPTPLAEAALIGEWPEQGALRALLTGGDRLGRRPSSTLPFRVVNHYGPTENTVVSTCAEVSAQDTAHRAPHIGRPIANTRIYVLDAHLQPVPVGVAGEIHIGGDGVARGYLNRPDLTAERFLPDPFAVEAGHVGARMYKTGDLGRWLPDGNLEYLGRLDDQVKIRGFRIELGEIEAVLGRHPAVREAAVVAREDVSGDKRLAAYVAAAADAPEDLTAELRRHLRESLPDYMVPVAFVRLDALPLTPNGKIDRKALPAPGRSEIHEAYVAPRTPTEALITGVWEEVLGREQVGAEDNFFELGGHSLLAVKVQSMLRERAGIELPIQYMFESPTPAALVERLTDGSKTAQESQRTGDDAIAEPTETIMDPAEVGEAPAAQGEATSIEEILERQHTYVKTWTGFRSSLDSFIVTINEAGSQKGLFWCLQGHRELTQLAEYLGSDQPVHGMRSGYLIMEYSEANIRAIAAHYAAEMIGLQPYGAFLLGGNCQAGIIAYAIAVRLRELGREVSLLFLMELCLFEPYDGQVALIFGRDSEFNPYTPGADPDAIFRTAYPAGYTVDIVSGGHGQFFETPNIETLAEAIGRRLDGHRQVNKKAGNLPALPEGQ